MNLLTAVQRSVACAAVCAIATMALAFVPTSFEAASEEAPSVVIVTYHWRPFWLSYFSVDEVLRGSLAPGATVGTFRQPIMGSERRHGHRYLLLLDENAKPYAGHSSCGTFNLIRVTDGEVAEVGFYDNMSPIPTRVTVEEVRLIVDTNYREPEITLLDRLRSGELDLDDILATLSNEDVVIRDEAVEALDDFGSGVRPIVPELLQLLATEPDHNVRYGLVLAVGNVKTVDVRVAESLASVLREDDSAFVRERAAREFWEMGVNNAHIPDVAIAALVTALEGDPNGGVRSQSAKALASNRFLTRQSRTVLEKCVADQLPQVKEVCQDALQGKYQ